MKRILLAFLAILSFVSIFETHASAQRRDYFTDEELELIRDAQAMDDRVAVLVHAMDRRFLVLKIDVATPIKEQKESIEWGKLPTGSRLNLLTDNKRIMQKVIDDIDNLAARPDSMAIPDPEAKKPKTYADVFPRAVRMLAAGAARFRPALSAELAKATDDREKGVLMDLLDACEQIAEAATKLPPEVKKTKN